MKKIFVFAFIIMSIVSCKKDDKEDKGLTGAWYPSKSVYVDCNYESDNRSIDYDANGCFDGDCLELVITDDMFSFNGTDGGYDFTQEYSYEINGSEITLNLVDDDEVITFTYTLSGDTFTLSLDDDGSGCKNTDTYKRK